MCRWWRGGGGTAGASSESDTSLPRALVLQPRSHRHLLFHLARPAAYFFLSFLYVVALFPAAPGPPPSTFYLELVLVAVSLIPSAASVLAQFSS